MPAALRDSTSFLASSSCIGDTVNYQVTQVPASEGDSLES
jgi:hypothetical protein